MPVSFENVSNTFPEKLLHTPSHKPNHPNAFKKTENPVCSPQVYRHPHYIVSVDRGSTGAQQMIPSYAQKSIDHVARYHTSQAYFLPSDYLEAQRLQEQHQLIINMYEDRLVLCGVPLDARSNVLDIGTGSGAWALDLAVNYPNADKANVIAIDIGTRLFPQGIPRNLSFKMASVLALPADWESHFTLVHQRLLMAGLKYDDWATVTKEIFRITVPGGQVQLCEADSFKSICGPSSEKCVKLVSQLDFDHSCVERIPGLLSEVGFVDVEVVPRSIKLGHWGGEIGKKCAQNLIGVWKGLKTPILRSAGFGMVKNEEEYDALMHEVEEEWEVIPGAEWALVSFTARKPN